MIKEKMSSKKKCDFDNRECIGCGFPGSKPRLCTGADCLCEVCRQLPQYKLWSFKKAFAETGIERIVFNELSVGTVVNPVNPRFKRVRVAYEKDVLEFMRKDS